MVIIIWFVLSLIGVCKFTWLPVLIDSIIYICIASLQKDESIMSNILTTIFIGVAGFSFYKFFFGLAISVWWILLSPIAIWVAMLFPGGFTIINLWFRNLGLMRLPTWGLIIGVLLDIASLVLVIWVTINNIKYRKEKN